MSAGPQPHDASSPSPPSGRLREIPAKTGANALASAAGCGEGRGREASPHVQTHKLKLVESLPHPPSLRSVDLSPQAGRGDLPAAYGSFDTG